MSRDKFIFFFIGKIALIVLAREAGEEGTRCKATGR